MWKPCYRDPGLHPGLHPPVALFGGRIPVPFEDLRKTAPQSLEHLRHALYLLRLENHSLSFATRARSASTFRMHLAFAAALAQQTCQALAVEDLQACDKDGIQGFTLEHLRNISTLCSQCLAWHHFASSASLLPGE